MLFGDFQARLHELAERGELAEALEFATREGGQFPLHVSRIHVWRMGLACRLGDLPGALQILDQTLARGSWLPVSWLEEQPDLDPLRSLPEYRELVEHAREYQARAQLSSTPHLLLQRPRPETGQPPYPLLVALHGDFRNAASAIEPWSHACAWGWVVALPQSSQVFAPDAFVWDDRVRGMRELQEHWTVLCGREDVDCQRAVLSGYTTGAALALAAALEGRVATRGVIAHAPVGLDLTALEATLEAASPSPPRVYLVAGELDVPAVEVVRALDGSLQRHDIPCEVEIRPGLTHDFPTDYDSTLERALAFVVNGS